MIAIVLLSTKYFYSQKLLSDANDHRKVIVKKLALCVPGRDDMELELSGDLSKLKKQVSL